ncbi:ComEC/Rec2 family competence protein [uncultured Polaribacter sp.]|uniref:ComEC/Rec2 family competence protein n=1 Tax=uncultured Polaribacter sp. TaxID=174711 RepID=UPI00263793BC|nr:ComEC/Rec2 family competence protein [uncultured Polaribacter sp.]
MKRLLNYLPLHFVVLIICGITTQFFTQFWKFGFLKLSILIVLISLFLLLIQHKKTITFLSFVLFFFIGISTVYFNNDVNYSNYYKDYINDNSPSVLKIDKVLKSSNFNDKYVVEVIQVNDIKTRGKAILNIKKDSLFMSLKVGELLFTKTDFTEVSSPLNPHQFNYKEYLSKQGVHQQIFLENSRFKRIDSKESSLQGISAKFRAKVERSLQKYNFKPNELAVINALLLGQRQDISKQLITDYSRAGAIHILAVSGLHVGVILLISSWFFKPLERLKNGKFIKTFFIVLFLWMFAFIAGLSASVVRAVTMFTFLAVGLSFQRKKIIEFSLIASMFFLLIVKPMFLFDVGFQLSYLAVFGIVWVQPKLYKFWQPKLKSLDKFWQLTTVSIAAQAGILPLSLYYFHQFPGLFIVSNLIIIPFLGAILIGGIVVITLSLFGVLPQVLATIYGFVISLMNSFVGWISNHEQFLFTEISMSFLKMLGLYILIIYVVRLFIKTSPKRLIYFLISIFICQSVFMLEKHYKKTKKEFIVFHKSKISIFGERKGGELLVHHNLDSLTIKKINLMTSYRIGENVNQVFKNNSSSIFKFNNQPILLVDSLGVYQIKGLKKPIVVLQYSPKINLERLIRTIKPKEIIADASNYKSYVKSWKLICRKQKTPFHYTGENGAYIIQKK